MISSSCLCQKRSLFKEVIQYKKEKVFKEYEGIVIGRCQKCGILKTFLPKKLIQKEKISRPEVIIEKKETFSLIYQDIIRRIKKYKKSGSVLDVGCSAGVFLTLLRKEGFSVFGIEPNKKPYLMAKKILKDKVYHGVLSNYFKKNYRQYDVIIYNHVLEHINEVNQELFLIKKILKKDGILVVGAPNYDNLIFYLRGKFWEALMPKEHIWHFSKNRLYSFLQKHNFQILEISFSDDRRSDYPFLKRIYFKILSFINKLFQTGETMLVIAKKT